MRVSYVEFLPEMPVFSILKNRLNLSKIEYIKDADHYNVVINAAMKARRFLWLGTADLKDLYVKQNRVPMPFLKALAKLLKNGVEVRLIHAKEPGKRFRDDFDKHPELIHKLERMLCPRAHFKLIIVDGAFAYIGSANLTGAGIGMKSSNRRNFEAGIWTSEPALVDQSMNQFDELWIGGHCKSCDRKDFCGDRVV